MHMCIKRVVIYIYCIPKNVFFERMILPPKEPGGVRRDPFLRSTRLKSPWFIGIQ